MPQIPEKERCEEGVTYNWALWSIDYLGELANIHGSGSTMVQIWLYRAKCAYLTKNVILPYLKIELIANLKDEKYTLIVDESTDTAEHKNSSILVQFFCERNKCIETHFMELVLIQEAKAENIFSIIEEKITECGQNLQNCLSFGSDGMSTMVGKNKTLCTRICSESTNCVQMSGIHHSLALLYRTCCWQTTIYHWIASSLSSTLVLKQWFAEKKLQITF